MRLSYFGPRPTRIPIDLRQGDPEPEPIYPMRGLGDLIERVTEKTGIKSFVESRAKKRGKTCGCSKRRDALNQLVPFRSENDPTETSND